MRWSSLYTPTLREAPGEADAVSHQLLMRGGFVRQLAAGHYILLPLGQRVAAKIIAIVEAEIERAGGQQVRMPTMHPASIWRRSGRWDSMGELMFRLRDRRHSEMAMGVTGEEVFATVAAELTSYRQLPQIWFQTHTKYRDEARPRSGLLRLREFTMNDSYSFDLDAAGLDVSFRRHHGAYVRIFERLGLEAIPVEASSGNMGGTDSIEFMVPAEAGEDEVVRCDGCGYAANAEKAVSSLQPIVDGEELHELEEFPTPGIRTISELATFEGGADPQDQVKTLVYLLDGVITLVLVRGDHQLNEQKLADATGAVNLRPATAEEVREALGASPGSLGPVDVTDHRVIADRALHGRSGMTTGANRDDWHVRGVDLRRDVHIDTWADLRHVVEGEPCVTCGQALRVVATIEVGHIFKLGCKYAETFGATVLDENGDRRPIVMGSYGIGIERNLATIIETHHDDKGITWPVNVAPYEVVVSVVGTDQMSMETASEIYQELRFREIDVVLDDRDLRAGVKFADAELIGIPLRITIGPKGLADGVAELTQRSTMATRQVPLAEVTTLVEAEIKSARA